MYFMCISYVFIVLLLLNLWQPMPHCLQTSIFPFTFGIRAALMEITVSQLASASRFVLGSNKLHVHHLVQDSAALPNQRARITPRDFFVFLAASSSPGLAKSDEATPPYEIDAQPCPLAEVFILVHHCTMFFVSSATIQVPTGTTALTPTFIVSSATIQVPTGTRALTPTFIVSPATPQVVRRRAVQVFFVVSVLYHKRVSTL